MGDFFMEETEYADNIYDLIKFKYNDLIGIKKHSLKKEDSELFLDNINKKM